VAGAPRNSLAQSVVDELGRRLTEAIANDPALPWDEALRAIVLSEAAP
jgi:hypothetical protein